MEKYTRVLKSALPLFLEGTNGKAVLVQHGFNGYPTEMYGLAHRLHDEGYTVVVPRLPGHATSLADFKKDKLEPVVSACEKRVYEPAKPV